KVGSWVTGTSLLAPPHAARPSVPNTRASVALRTCTSSRRWPGESEPAAGGKIRARAIRRRWRRHPFVQLGHLEGQHGVRKTIERRGWRADRLARLTRF